MESVVLIFLCVSILLYFLLGGADFGAGIVELLTSRKNLSKTRKTMYHAIGPVWEANHMWLIIAVVILFVGFPVIYSTMSVYLHIPLAIMLIGIIARGTAFVFRHYDAVKDSMQQTYNRIFVYSSFITPLFLGIIAGSVISRHIDTGATDFASAYIWGWLNGFSVSVGLFTVALCGFLAAIYLIGESDDHADRKRFIRKAKQMNLAAVASGCVVFIFAEQDEVPLRTWIFENPVGLSAVIAATLSLVALWYLLLRGKTTVLRILAGFQVTMILLAISYAHFPYFLRLKNGRDLSLYEHMAPEKTMQTLGIALLAGSVLILPFLGYLFYSFQRSTED
ncbi:cytochrome d ubiquinol oxidase subunit II [Pedobacter sp. SYP-B3415]|uniref:cytochrome d ubiquinol oxidase subunit II n=1 Tax=Pedobacter sp. SYP-B3415 TaxID=2496641 RepID=UPI00101C2E7C|nr:cytochrome d ubiquinol oxidase subunit II [Pedobacter sp. SYP-B3415]